MIGIYGPSVSLAFPPVGWHRTVAHDPQRTTVWACEKTDVMAKQPKRRKTKSQHVGLW